MLKNNRINLLRGISKLGIQMAREMPTTCDSKHVDTIQNRYASSLRFFSTRSFPVSTSAKQIYVLML